MDNGDISSIISKIIENPEFAGMVNELRGQNVDSAQTSKEMLDKLPEVMKMVSPMLGGQSDGEKKSNGGQQSAPVPVKKNGGKYDKVRATKLMQALKPYLSHERGEIIDKCVSVMQIGDIVEAFGGIENIIKHD